jgi:hypothetical protein
MGSRQRPSPHARKDHGGEQARAGEGDAAQRRAAEQRREEEEMLAAARDDVDEALPSDEPAGQRAE